jgi:hypothetical protein
VSRLEALESAEVQLQLCSTRAASLKEDVLVYLINMAISQARRNCELLQSGILDLVERLNKAHTLLGRRHTIFFASFLCARILKDHLNSLLDRSLGPPIDLLLARSRRP